MADLARRAERQRHLATLAADLEPYLIQRLGRVSASTVMGTGSLTAHALDGAYHTGTLSTSQAPWAVTTTSFNSHISNPDAHHAKQHDIVSALDHSISGAALSVVGATALNTLGLLTPSAAPGAAEALLKSTSAGLLTLPQFTATTKMVTPRIDTASGTLSLQPAGTTVQAVGALRSTLGTTDAGGAVVQGVVDADNSFSRIWVGHNAKWDSSGNLWNIDNVGANDTAGLFVPNGSSSIDLIFHASTGASSRTMDHATFTAGRKFRFTNTGELQAGDGSTSAPAFSFTADTNTGLYRSGTDAYSLVAGGAAIVNVGATGAAVNASYDSTAALKVQSVANDDITLFLKQKSGQTARMWRVEDSAGQELIVLDSQGNLQSGNPGFVSGLTGWQITPTGTAEFNNVWVRGELHASIFVMDEFHASGGTLVVAPAGKLENDATVYTTTGVSQVLDIRTTSGTGSGSQIDIRTTSGTGSGTQITSRWIENYFEITDPPSGHATIFAAGDTLRCKSLGNTSPGIDLYDVWGTVQRIEDMTDYYRYYYTRQSGGSDGIVIPAGAAVISYGVAGDGRILLTADQNYAPYIDIFTSGASPWAGDITPHTRLGRLDGVGLPGVSGIEQYGMVTSTDLSDATAPYIVNSNLQMFSYNVDSEWNNGNPTARITSGGEFRLGTDVDADATTGLLFNPTTGALTIGSASYPGTVTVYGSITVTGGSGYANFSDKPTSLSGINGTEGTKLAGIADNATVGATWGTNLNSIPTRFGDAPGAAGLYLTPTHLGYYDGSAWKAWIASGGQFYFGGSSGAHLEWNGSKLRGIGTDGTTEQWYAQASDGKLYAAAGAIGLDSTGIWLRMNASSSWATANAITFRNSSTWATIDAVLSTKTVTSSRYLNLLIDPDATPVGLEVIASPSAQRVNITHDLTVSRDLTVSGVTYADGGVDMGGSNLTNIGSAGTVSTWTPAITFGGGSTGITYSSRTGRYVKIGKLVYASCEIRLSNKGSSTGAAKIGGLPATSATTAAGGVPSIIWYQMASSFVHVSGGVDSAATTITLVGYTAAATNYASLTHSDFANNSIIQMTVMYEVA